MVCIQGEPLNELEFVRGLTSREAGDCLGVLVTQSFEPDDIGNLEACLAAPSAVSFLWDSLVADHPDPDPVFAMCAAHWLDIAAMTAWRARACMRADWHQIASELTSATCRAAGWDPKEISNMFVWRRVPLT